MIMESEALRRRWMDLRAQERGLHALEVAERLGVSELELYASACGGPGEVSATRLDVADFPAFIGRLPELGFVKAVTRSKHAVIENEGTYGAIEFFGAMGQSVSSIDLRIFSSRWRHALAVREETRRGVSRGLSFYDEAGTAIHKLFLREASDVSAFDRLVREHTARDQASQIELPSTRPAPPRLADALIDVEGLRSAWLGMKDTHELHGILRRFQVERVQALRLVGDDVAYRVPASAFEDLLGAVAGTDLAIMIFVGNPAVIQIHSGPIQRVATMGSWVNVLDPGFDLHVRSDRIESAWVVKKPIAEGRITSLEIYDAEGTQMALVVSKRKHDEDESPIWRAAVEALPRA